MHLSGDESLQRLITIPGMRLFLVPPQPCAMQVRLDAAFELPDCRWLHAFTIADGEVPCRFGVSAEGAYYYTFGSQGLLRYREGQGVDISPLHSVPTLRFALWTAYAMMGMGLGSLPVHSSVAVCGGKAVMCLGESGTGKSTHTRLWIEHIVGTTLLNDDSPVVAVHPDGVRVYGSPWGGKTPWFLTESYPIAGLVRLEQQTENRIRRLNTAESVAALLPSCPPSLACEEHCLDLLADFVGEVISTLPVYRLGCRPDAEAAQLVYRTIM